MEQLARNPALSLSGKSYHLCLSNLFPRKGTLRISIQTLKNRFMTRQLGPANNPQVDRGSGHNDAISPGQANFVAATVLWEPQRYTVPALSTCGNTVGAWGLHRPLLFVVCLPCFTSVEESADETVEGGCLLFLRQHMRQGKIRCQSVQALHLLGTFRWIWLCQHQYWVTDHTR